MAGQERQEGLLELECFMGEGWYFLKANEQSKAMRRQLVRAGGL